MRRSRHEARQRRDHTRHSERRRERLSKTSTIRALCASGAEVNSGDVLVGKITPKGETQLSPEEKLLRAIFGEKAGDVRDTSLKVPPGVTGIVIDARVFARKGTEKDERSGQIEVHERAKLEKDMADEIKIIEDSAYDRLRKYLLRNVTTAKLVDDAGRQLLAKGAKIEASDIDAIPRKYWGKIEVERNKDKIDAIVDRLDDQLSAVKLRLQEKIDKLGKGDELPPGVIKMVKGLRRDQAQASGRR